MRLHITLDTSQCCKPGVKWNDWWNTHTAQSWENIPEGITSINKPPETSFQKCHCSISILPQSVRAEPAQRVRCFAWPVDTVPLLAVTGPDSGLSVLPLSRTSHHAPWGLNNNYRTRNVVLSPTVTVATLLHISSCCLWHEQLLLKKLHTTLSLLWLTIGRKGYHSLIHVSHQAPWVVNTNSVSFRGWV